MKRDMSSGSVTSTIPATPIRRCTGIRTAARPPSALSDWATCWASSHFTSSRGPDRGEEPTGSTVEPILRSVVFIRDRPRVCRAPGGRLPPGSGSVHRGFDANCVRDPVPRSCVCGRDREERRRCYRPRHLQGARHQAERCPGPCPRAGHPHPGSSTWPLGRPRDRGRRPPPAPELRSGMGVHPRTPDLVTMAGGVRG